MRSSVAEEILAAAANKDKGEILRTIEKMIASADTEKYMNMEEAVEPVIAECRRGLDRAVS